MANHCKAKRTKYMIGNNEFIIEILIQTVVTLRYVYIDN